MAKKAEAVETIEVAPQPKVKKVQAKPEFEFKDRTYYIATGKSPLI